MHLHAEQQARAVDFLNSLPWADVDGAIRTFEQALRLALEATREPFVQWEEEADGRGFVDEFSLTSDEVALLTDDWRLAYVARLLRSLALAYGVSAEFGGDTLVGEAQDASVGGVVRALNDIAWIRVDAANEA